MLNNLHEVLTGQYTGLLIELCIIVLSWALMIVAVCIDLWSGVERAKVCGEKPKSNKFRRTIEKVGEYWRVMVFGLFIDVVIFLLLPYYVPFGSLIFMAACCSIEAKSVIENLRRKKSAAAEVPRIVIDILRNLDNPDKLSKYVDILNKINNKHQDDCKK